MKKPLLLTIIDGFGISEEVRGNAVKLANMPNYNSLLDRFPHSQLEASGKSVGLPEGQMGNSEVGHLNIGAGRVVYQPLELISNSIEEGSFYENEKLKEVIEHVKENNSKLHIFGLLSDGGIHSHINHIFALLELAKKENIKDVYVHAFLDGRDTLPNLAISFLDQLQIKMNELGIGVVADISGRYYSMDRERMWNVTKKYYDALVYGDAPIINNYKEFINSSYEKGIYDEFIIPTIININGKLEENDGLIFGNFRPDRATQTFTAITNPEFKEFPRKDFKNIKLVTLMPVENSVISKPAFKNLHIENGLGTILSNNNKKVLRIAEASKYPHVTYFFDGGVDLSLPGTTQIIVPRKDVATYDLAPEMSANEITDKLVEIMGDYDVIILNFANTDMVGHTGKIEAAIKACETVDNCLGRLYKHITELNGLIIVTADHGNCELMIDKDDNIITSHTTNKVPFIICNEDVQIRDGKLADIAPTILSLLDIEIPEEMTGDILI